MKLKIEKEFIIYISNKNRLVIQYDILNYSFYNKIN